MKHHGLRFINLFIIIANYKKGDKTDCNNYQGILLLATLHKIVSDILLPAKTKLLGIINVGFHIRDQPLIKFLHSPENREKWKYSYNETLHQLFIDFKKAYESVRREVLHNILRVFMKLVK
jgi:hypothetical protein